MGRAVIAALSEKDRILAGLDTNPGISSPFPIFTHPDDVAGRADVIVDFSHHSALQGLLAYAVRNATPIVVCTTGHTEDELAAMREAATKVPIFFSGNMSLGINLLAALCRRAARTLGLDFDVEIIEKHHNQKLDAPSGTALMLANAVAEADNTPHPFVYDRTMRREARPRGEIGIHSLRGGSIVGEHEVIFAGKNEVISLSHSAASREVFAVGALRAAAFLIGKAPGLYNMDDLLGE